MRENNIPVTMGGGSKIHAGSRNESGTLSKYVLCGHTNSQNVNRPGRIRAQPGREINCKKCVEMIAAGKE